MNRLDFISSFWQRYYLFIVGAFCFLFALIGSLVSLHRYWQYEAFYFDFGIFDQAIWNVSRFKPPVIEHFVIGSKWIFADHFNPSIFLLSPLYWLTSRSEMLLIVQAVIVAISGFVLFSFANRILKNSFASFVILYCYFFYTTVMEENWCYDNTAVYFMGNVWYVYCYSLLLRWGIYLHARASTNNLRENTVIC